MKTIYYHSDSDAASKAGPRVALVLGAAVHAAGVPSPTLARRAQHAAALWHQGEVDIVIGCGGTGQHPPAEGAVIADLCRQAGLPEAVLRVEAASHSTRENIALALPILRELRPRQIILVTDHWHAPRARLIARQMGLQTRSDSPPGRGPLSRRLRAIAREALAIPATLLRLR